MSVKRKLCGIVKPINGLNENAFFRYDLVGVTVHTGTADGGHYYSFIKERNSVNGQQDRWFLFNDAEVKIFDPSQIAAECFGGEMIVSVTTTDVCLYLFG